MRKRQYPHPSKSKKRLDKAKILVRDLKAGTAEREFFFADENLFTIEASVNNQNERVYAKPSAVIDESVRTVYRRQNPFSLMVWAVVSKSSKPPLIFAEQV